MNVDLTIIIPTLGRVKEVNAMIESIYRFPVEEIYKIEIIIVDQNFSDILDPIVNLFRVKKYPIEHHKVSFRGLSKAKNYGVAHAHGRYICCIDDDAEFTDGIINRALGRLDKENVDIISGRCVDRSGANSVLHFEGNEAILTLSAFENRFVESTMFFKREICERYHYDENMGVGAFYGAEEGYDLVYRMLQDRVRILYDPELKFYHPQTVVDHSSIAAARRTYSYHLGTGYLCKKHQLNKKYWQRIILLILYIPYLSFFKRSHLRYYMGEFLGMIVGRFV